MTPGSTLTIRPPADFAFRRTVLSHGWYALAPFRFDPERGTLSGVSAAAGRWEVAATGTALRVRVAARLAARDRASALAEIRSSLRLDEEFGEFFGEVRRVPALRWIARSRSGRLLRAPTVFEDAVKMLCTTNCTWALTEAMVTRLVERFGKDGAFPAPGTIAASTERELRSRCTLGYRAPFVLALARRVDSGTLEIESWRSAATASAELYETIRRERGFGPYAAGNLLKLLGHYDYLGLDSWVRARYAALNGRPVSDRTIERRYTGRWRGLIFWLEMTRHWHDEKFRRAHGA